MTRLHRITLTFALLALPATAHYPAVRVIDGDTVSVPLTMIERLPSLASVRLVGVNAPELRGKCEAERQLAEAARLYVRDRIDQAKTVRVEFVRWDAYGGRVDGRITIDGKDLGADLIAAGLAVPSSGKRVGAWCR